MARLIQTMLLPSINPHTDIHIASHISHIAYFVLIGFMNELYNGIRASADQHGFITLLTGFPFTARSLEGCKGGAALEKNEENNTLGLVCL